MIKDAKTRWVCTDGYGAEIEIEAVSAKEAAWDYAFGGEWGDRNETIFVDVDCAPVIDGEADWDNNERITVGLDPIDPNPECDHEWIEISVVGHGAGVVHTEKCEHCGLTKTTDTWHTRYDGNQSTMVKYD